MKVMGFLAPTTTGFTMSLTTVAKRGCLPANTNTQVVSNRTSRRTLNGPLAVLQVAQTSGMVSLSFFDRLFHRLYAGDEFCRTFSVLFPDSRSRESQNNHRFFGSQNVYAPLNRSAFNFAGAALAKMRHAIVRVLLAGPGRLNVLDRLAELFIQLLDRGVKVGFIGYPKNH